MSDAIQGAIDALNTEVRSLTARIEGLEERRAIVQRALDELAEIGAPPAKPAPLAVMKPKPAPATPSSKTSTRSEAAKLASARRATCEVCGREMSATGIGTHRRLAHGIVPGIVPGAKPSTFSADDALRAIEG